MIEFMDYLGARYKEVQDDRWHRKTKHINQSVMIFPLQASEGAYDGVAPEYRPADLEQAHGEPHELD